ncbi:uncharacterized protein LOC100903202 [Galendromus occidentalis]|uniref:Uncharacterized protein LOC100903202 n=1 Tax=Galendromus occidentalis TaxID=34638 RepID=A0AAJ6QNV1_9ACAR|nr:uncharacterized protein LOC100903202 [Galendromus occidentalis]
MTSITDREFVDPGTLRSFASSEVAFCVDEDEGGGESDDAKPEDLSENSVAPDDGSVAPDDGSVLQSTPVNGPPPSHEASLPSAIKSLPVDDIGIVNLPKRAQKSKSIFSRLSSIAEKSFSSPLRTKRTPSDIIEEPDLETVPFDENNNTMGSLDSHPRTPPGDGTTLPESHCGCTECKEAVAQDRVAFCERASEISCSLASLTTTHNSPRATKEPFGKFPVSDEEDNDDANTSILCEEKPERNPRISDGVQRLSKFLHSTVRAGRKSISKSNSRSGFDSETSSNTIGARSCRTFHGEDSRSIRENVFLSRCLRKLASAVSIHRYSHETGSIKTDIDDGSIDNDQISVSNNSLMFVLLSPKPGEVEFDHLIWGSGDDNGSQKVPRDPALRSVLEELRSIMLTQEVVVKQASKALDECSSLVRKQADGIIFAEQLLNIASQSYFSAERELHRLLDGGVFEPQKDHVALEKISFQLPEFRSPINLLQSYFLVLVKCGHRLRSSELICVASLRERWLTVENWKRYTEDKDQNTDCVFEFNRPDWRIDIEVYFVCKRRRASLASLDRIARLMDNRGPPSREMGSNRNVEVRKSSFGLLGKATLSKEDIIEKSAVYLTQSHGYAPFRSQIFFEGKAFVHSRVSYEAYLIVKDFNGRFGSKGQMRTFSARLSNQRLDFFERYDNSDEKAEPRETILLNDIPEESVVVDNDDCTYFYDFTLKLNESKESWLHLCTNSREDTDLWIDQLRLALREPSVTDLQSLSSRPDATVPVRHFQSDFLE